MLTTPRVAVLCSRRAPGLAHLLARGRDADAPFTVVCCVTSEDAFADADIAIAHDVPLISHSLRAFRATHAPDRRPGDLQLRAAYDRQTVSLLTEYRPDIVLLAGYLLRLTEPVLSTHAGRVINVHHSDLLLRAETGGPRYPGLRAVRDAILAGETETRSCAHLVTDRLDEGPVLARSPAFPVSAVAHWARDHGQHDILKSAIWMHQEWMLREAFGPLMVDAIDAVASSHGTALLECGS